MPSRIITYLNKNTLADIKVLAKKSKKTLSATAAELIDIGYQLKQHQEKQNIDAIHPKKEELISRHTQYLLMIMAITSDILRCIRNEKSKYTEKTADEAINRIEKNTLDFIKNFIEKG